jgi:hypothetical protein
MSIKDEGTGIPESILGKTVENYNSELEQSLGQLNYLHTSSHGSFHLDKDGSRDLEAKVNDLISEGKDFRLVKTGEFVVVWIKENLGI